MRLWEQAKKRRRLWLILSTTAAVGFAAALILTRLFVAGPESISDPSTIRDTIPVREAKKRKVHLYFATSNGRHLQAEERRVEASDIHSAVEAIIESLLDGPSASPLVSTIPAGTELRHLFVTDDRTAYVDFNTDLSNRHPGGVTAERLTFYAIVNSIALNIEEVERVQLLLDGKPAPTLSGHLDIRHARVANLLIIR
ncbi:MAG: GerMN domain-containing protein [Deltaproteobacteria bacterium]|nr:MAG: GerMN domain-containing protein [Deltaproteobacteria bacterium]